MDVVTTLVESGCEPPVCDCGDDDQRRRNPEPRQAANPFLRINARKCIHPRTE